MLEPENNVILEDVEFDCIISETDKRFFFQQFRGYGDMAIIVKGEIKITKGFNTWKSMVKKNKHRMDEMGMVMLFAGVQKDDPTKLHAIMKFPDMEAFQAFGSNEELTEERKKAGAVFESGVMTMISVSEFFTNFPEPFVKA